MLMQPMTAPPRLKIAPIETTASLRTLAYDAIKKAITEPPEPPIKVQRG